MVDEELLELAERKVETRDTTTLSCIVFDIDSIERTFHDSISLIENTLQKGREQEESDRDFANGIYRFLVASLESVFDYFVHCVIKLGFKEIFLQEREQTRGYKKYTVPLSLVTELLADPTNPEALMDYVNKNIARETYMPYQRFKEAMSFVSDNLLLDVASELYPEKKCEGLKGFMDNLYSRRNLIVHQDDRLSSSGAKNEISYSEVLEYKDEFVKLVDCIIKHIKNRSE